MLCVLLAVSLLATATAPSIAPADPTRYLNDIKSLAAPVMEGRGAGTKGLERPQDTSSTDTRAWDFSRRARMDTCSRSP